MATILLFWVPAQNSFEQKYNDFFIEFLYKLDNSESFGKNLFFGFLTFIKVHKGGILKPCGPLGGRGGSWKVHVSPQGGGGAIDAVHVDQIY